LVERRLMAGIIFFKTQAMDECEKFYTDRIGMHVWLRQADCIILKHENLLLGFCTRKEVDHSGMITFVYRSREEVDAMYARLKDLARESPRENEKYRIYQFFAHDPEDRILEFQYFLHPVDI
jgi:predicted lactoylglutathione lyase